MSMNPRAAKLIAAIEGQDELVMTRYFEDLDRPETCRVCAIGALIRALPPEKRECCLAFLRERDINSAYIWNPRLDEVAQILCDEYRIPRGSLTKIQDVNDFGAHSTDTVGRGARVKQYVRQLAVIL
jgi:hypothetical protein